MYICECGNVSTFQLDMDDGIVACQEGGSVVEDVTPDGYVRIE